jgi:SWI/SNF-related matrix-associated actin-dependent regulator of chromatin subfamily A-like protein 1
MPWEGLRSGRVVWSVLIGVGREAGRVESSLVEFTGGAHGIHRSAYRWLFVSDYFVAFLDGGEAVLRFPYDDRLRVLLRAIPGRRWDPVDKAWRVPLDPERAHALATLMASLPHRLQVSNSLARTLKRGCARRRREECVLDLARPDERWWLSFALDAQEELVDALMQHPDAYRLPAIGRGLIPLDEHAERIVGALCAQHPAGLRLSEDAEHALTEIAQRAREMQRVGVGVGGAGGEHMSDGRASEDSAGDARSYGQQARIDDDDYQSRPLPRPWHGTIDVAGEPGAPVFLLLGEVDRLPPEMREHAVGAPGGATVPLTEECWQLIEEHLDGWITKAATRCVAALHEDRPAPPAVLEVSRVHEEPTFVLAPGHDPDQCERFAALPGAMAPMHRASGSTPPRRGHDQAHRRQRRGGGRGYGYGSGYGHGSGYGDASEPGSGSRSRSRSRYGLAPVDEHARLAAIRADPFCVPALDEFLDAHGTWIEPGALELLQEAREQHARAQGLVELSSATDAELYVTGLGGELKPFQRAGVSYLLARRRAFLADEQGLGKTIEALATLQADGAFPAVVACPASLKLNWLREIERWLPGRSARALAGVGPASPFETRLAPADITVVNYDIVAARLQELCALRPRALVVDESHYCKNATAKRTQAVQQLAGAVPEDGLVLALTGTPVMNRPPELISQLRIIGRIGDFGSGAQFGRRFRGPDAHMRLHWHLRARCYVRRVKADVLPQLPPKTRGIVPVELTNEHEYRLAEHDLVAWLRTQPLDLRQLDAKVAAALRAERLVRLNALKLIAARGKLHAALAWIHDFCSSGEPLVVFAKHREIQQAVLERFPRALHILGTDSHLARDASLRAFQDESDGQLIVCSLEVAGQGLTLTRASNVVFLELDWTPAKHDQAEDRCHRIGQQDAVNATYLLAASTIDETIAALLERKRAVIDAVTDGREQDEESVLDALVRELAGEPYRALRAVA